MKERMSHASGGSQGLLMNRAYYHGMYAECQKPACMSLWAWEPSCNVMQSTCLSMFQAVRTSGTHQRACTIHGVCMLIWLQPFCKVQSRCHLLVNFPNEGWVYAVGHCRSP